MKSSVLQPLWAGRFVTSASQMNSLFDYLKVRGFAFLDNGMNPVSLTPSVASSKQVPYAVANSVIDNTQLSRVVIDSKLAQIERIAMENGSVIALGRPYPVTLETSGTLGRRSGIPRLSAGSGLCRAELFAKLLNPPSILPRKASGTWARKTL